MGHNWEEGLCHPPGQSETLTGDANLIHYAGHDMFKGAGKFIVA